MAIRPKDLALTNQERNELLEMHGRATIHLKQFSDTPWIYNHRPPGHVIQAFVEIWRKLGWNVEFEAHPSGIRFVITATTITLSKGG